MLAYGLTVLLLGAIPPPQGGVQVNLMAIRAFVRRQGHICYAINLTRHRRQDEDGLFFPSSAAEVIKLLFKLRADIIHLHIGGDLTTRLLVLGAICSFMPRAKIVLTFHSGGYPSSEEGRALKSSGVKARLLRCFHRFIAVNEEIREFFLRMGVPADHVRVISPFSSITPYQGALPASLEEFIAAHQPLVVTIGLLEPEYDLPLQIELVGDLLQHHPRIGLLIVGSGSLQASLRDQIVSRPWRDHILLYGDLEHSMTLAALKRADIFLRTTVYDGDALSVREALELGLPVVATRTKLRPEGVHLFGIGDRVAAREAVLCCLAQKATSAPERDNHGEKNIEAVFRLYQEVWPADAAQSKPR